MREGREISNRQKIENLKKIVRGKVDGNPGGKRVKVHG
jgi:hypothetical protein